MAAGLILLRHGESTANADGLFTGALDVDLTQSGEAQSIRAGQLLTAEDLTIDVVICSPLTRARHSARLVMAALHQPAELILDWRLIERSYGALTGRSKADVLQQVGQDIFMDWRRSVDHAPPPLTDDRLCFLRSQPALVELPPAAVAATESLDQVVARVRPFLRDAVVPRLRSGQTALVVAHGNSLRALCAAIDGLGDDDLRGLNIPSGQPLLYRIHSDGIPVAGSGEYLDAASARAATIVLEQQGGT